MSQIVSSLPNKFEQGIFAALCFDFSLSKNLVIYHYALAGGSFLNNVSYHCLQILNLHIVVVIGSANVKPFLSPATIS